MEFLPVFLNIRDRKCVIVGGGEVAVRKARLLSRAEAKLHIIAPQLNTEMQSLCKAQAAVVTIGAFEPSQLAGAVLAIAATDDIKTNIAVSVAAKEYNIPVNVVDEPKYCTFITPAVVDRSPLVIAISSSGSSPILTRQVKALNETMLPARMAELATLLREFRDPVQESLSNFEDRVKFWEGVLDSEIPELVYSGQLEQGRDKLAARLTNKTAIDSTGEVYLVGAGPGDPDLLTLRALRLMHKADIVLYDRLVSDEIMFRIRPDAERIHVGKARSEHSVEQGKINQMLVDFARAGKRVLRLKGGDPFVFGRGGEELDSLAEARIPFQIVPGITAATGCAAYAGIPLTHRDYAQSVRFLTGHTRDGKLDHDWPELARKHQTLVFYMSLSGLDEICRQLISHGMPSSTPSAVIQQGTISSQRVVCAELKNLPAQVEEAKLKAPTLTIIGDVVSLRDKLAWFGEH